MAVVYINEQGARLKKSEHRLIVEKEGRTIASVPCHKIEQIIIYGNIEITTPAISFVLRNDIDTVFMTEKGKYKGRLISRNFRHSELRMKQYEFCLNKEKILKTAQKIVLGKIANYRVFIKRHNSMGNEALAVISMKLKQYLEMLDTTNDLEKLRGYEGITAKLYFESLTSIIKQPLGFKGRNRRPPTDPVNSLLSFGYTILFQKFFSLINLVGLDPYLGFFHSLEYNRPSLVLDIMEEFRPLIVDTTVVSMINKRQINGSDFNQNPSDHSVTISKGVIGLYMKNLEERLETKIHYTRENQDLSYHQVMEKQVRLIARIIMGEEEEYMPYIAR